MERIFRKSKATNKVSKLIIALVIMALIFIYGCSKTQEKTLAANDKKCSDGTKLTSCSTNKPKYCFNNLELRDKCDLCGCPDELLCRSDGSCKEAIVEKDDLDESLKQLDLFDNI